LGAKRRSDRVGNRHRRSWYDSEDDDDSDEEEESKEQAAKDREDDPDKEDEDLTFRLSRCVSRTMHCN
jgi:hypothetical protein